MAARWPAQLRATCGRATSGPAVSELMAERDQRAVGTESSADHVGRFGGV